MPNAMFWRAMLLQPFKFGYVTTWTQGLDIE